MIKKISAHFVMTAMILLMTSADLFAQTRIRFAKGRSSATVSGTIAARSNKNFVVGASNGQSARVSVSPRNLQIFSNEAPKGESGNSSFETNSGDNDFGIYNPTSRAIRYTMTISIR